MKLRSKQSKGRSLVTATAPVEIFAIPHYTHQNLTMKSKIHASAAKRILGLPQSRKITFAHVGDQVLVSDKNTAYVLTEQQFEDHHEQIRREGAKECIASMQRSTAYNTVYRVTGSKGDYYYVELAEGRLQCDCNDWISYEEECKHCYSVLNLLGVHSLQDFLLRDQARVQCARVRPPSVRGVSIE